MMRTHSAPSWALLLVYLKLAGVFSYQALAQSAPPILPAMQVSEEDDAVDINETLVSGINSCPTPFVEAEGPRYVAITPVAPADDSAVALVITSPDYPGLFSYVDTNGKLTCAPEFRTAAQWGTVHLGDLNIIPVTLYSVRAVCSNSGISDSMMTQTWKWGDVNNTNVVSLDDILCVLNGFSGSFTVCSRYADDLLGFTPNGIVNLDDILVVLAAFSGQTYPGPVPPQVQLFPQPIPGTACDDGNPCTNDTCTAGVCTHSNNTAPCSDNNACTTNDTCTGGVCVSGSALSCPDDSNPCTDDCHPTLGCSHTFNAAPCDDGNACTTNDVCSGGACGGDNAAASGCDDLNPCTDDTCDPEFGCVNTNIGGSCDDGQYCTVVDSCVDGVCVGSGDPCPAQVCDEPSDSCMDPALAAPLVTNGPFDPTDETVLQITGTAAGGASVEVSGSLEVDIAPIIANTFVANVLLAENQVNQICLATLGPAGGRSASTCVSVVQDLQPPHLFIDYPVASTELTVSSTDVMGRVGDVLTGYLNLSVTVNGTVAEVETGIGNNGTFLAMGVPLELGISTITATATDLLGNTTTKEIQVKRIELDVDTPQMAIVSGNGQAAPVHMWLPDPIVVHVDGVGGVPFANKLVTFEVQRSDGRLSEDGSGLGTRMVQVRTDTNGDATVYWRVGSDAGCGNNRVEARSTSIEGTVVFCATATHGPPSQINVGFGNNQRVEAGGLTPDTLRAWVNDGCNGVPGETVFFNVIEGGGLVNGAAMTAVVTSITGHAEVEFRAGAEPGINIVEASYAGNPGVPATFQIVGIGRDPAMPTRFTGVVQNNAEQPIVGATVSLTIGADAPLITTTDALGRFEYNAIESAGSAELVVNGLSATMVGETPIPQGSYPSLFFVPVIVPNAENTLGVPVVLPPLNPTNAKTFDNSKDVDLTVDGIAGLKMKVKAGSMRLFDGVVPAPGKSTIVSLNQVHFDKIPMPMPNGAAPPFAWTLQPSGSTFDPPVEIEMPNMAGLPADSIVYFLSFNHDTERFEIAASGHVTADGQSLVTDPGSGLTRAGWGGFCPPYPNSGTVQNNPDNVDPPGPDEEPPCKGAPPASSECPSCENEGGTDPIHLFSGEFYDDFEDLRIKGRGMDFVWSRKYRSKTGPVTAQGNGWDFSYNLFLEQQGPDVALCDGNSRRDVYKTQGSGLFIHRRFSRQMSQNGDNTFSLEFSEKSKWNFHAFDGSMVAGKVASIVDRNNNVMSFDYDALGRLQTISDTLGRDITVTYNADGFIDSVTDFTGRQVQYDYYQNSDAGGSFGDLKSVTTPAVVGTPNGNDFPDGKTTIYTYSKGFADNRLNHNLLSIRDPKGQVYVSNVYSTATNPAALDFDRVVRQIWGNQGPTPELTDTIDLVYVTQTPNSANNFATIRVILNDRVGNVKEYFYDALHRVVIEREYTGRANPDQPTTVSANRPTGRLRPEDPAYFETKYRWNKESQLSQITYPNGDVQVLVRDSDLNSKSAQRTHSNVRMRVHQRAGSSNGAAQALLSEMYEYDTDFGGCCGTNFITKQIDRRGGITQHQYDNNGNCTKIIHRIPSIVEDFEYNQYGQMTAHVLPANGSNHRRRDEMTYYSSGPQNGYVHQNIVDVTGFALTTSFEYDAVGNMVRMVDARGFDTQLTVNERNQVVRELSPEVEAGSGVRYRRDTTYDANDNPIQTAVRNTDENGVLQANTDFTTTYEYDVLNYLTRVTQEVDVGHFIVTEFAYDASRHRTLVKSGEATNGHQPTNVVRTLYDERELPFRVIRGDGDLSKSTIQNDYDRSGNLVRKSSGLENTPRVTIYTYDTYNRVATVTDPMKNVATFGYDANGNKVSVRVDGELNDLPNGSANVRLSQTSFVFDAMDRPTLVNVQLFDTDTQVAIDDGWSTTQLFYADDSQMVRIVNDNDHETLFTYDTANRQSVTTDAKGNSITNTYDGNANVVAVQQVEKSDLGGPDEVFNHTFAYDGLNRLTRSTDNVGNTTVNRYDSRQNRTTQIDARGNIMRYQFDGLNRLEQVTHVMTDTGDGGGAIVDQITTRQAWDDTSRVIGQTDDHGNTTSYVYDALDRKIREGHADGSAKVFVHDVHDNVLSTIDANGSVLTNVYDLNNRRTSARISVGVGVSNDTTSETYRFDGLSRLVYAQDNDSLVTRSYDSLSRPTRETQSNGPTGAVTTGSVLSTFDGVGNQLSCTYPGGRVIMNDFDSLERKKMVVDTTSSPQVIANYDFVGPGRIVRREYGNGTRLVYEYNGLSNAVNDFGVRQVVRATHSKIAGAVILDDRTFTWDRMMNKSKTEDVRPGGPMLRRDYQYDSIYRMTESTKTPPGGASGAINYALDGVGNRTLVTGGSNSGLYTMSSALPEPADLQVNQYTTTPVAGNSYDKNGNLIAIDEPPVGAPTIRTIEYDYRNQMVRHTDAATGVVTNYGYDALGRRYRKVVDVNGVSGGPTETRFFLDGWREIEEQTAGGSTLATYTFGTYIDDLSSMRRDVDLSGTPEDYYYHADDLGSIMAVSDATGSVVERYDYDDYGKPQIKNASSMDLAQSAIRNPFMFTARRLDAETDWFEFRTRYLDPAAGKFTTRDRVGVWTAAGNKGNGYVYAASNPSSRLDPFGTWDEAGHFYTVYMVAIAAGRPVNEAYHLAYFAQYPDELRRYDAVWTAGADVGSDVLLSATGPVGRGAVAAQKMLYDSWGKRINERLHSLHGGDPIARQCCLRGMLQDPSLKLWERGMLMHAFGDSFAHTYEDNGKRVAYGYPLGHAWDSLFGTDPDVIANNSQMYQNYVNQLYVALGGAKNGKKHLLQQIIDTANTTGTDHDATINTMAGLAGSKDFKYNWKYRYQPEGSMKTDPMMDEMYDFGMSDVNDLLNKIQDACK